MESGCKELAFAEAKQATDELRRLFKTRMKELGLRQVDLARKMGKSRANLAVLLSQDNVLSLSVILEFCYALDLDLNLVISEKKLGD